MHFHNTMYLNPLKHKQSTASEESQPAPAPAHPLVLARERAISKADHDKIHEDEDVQWLKSKAATHNGYDEFCKNWHQKLKNNEHVRFWAFAAEFLKDYFGFTSGALVCWGNVIDL